MRTTALRTAAATAAALAALVLGGCGSGDEAADGEDKDGAPTTPAATASPDPTGVQDGGADGAAGGIEGTWAGLTDAKPVVLSLTRGKAALLAEGRACTGDVTGSGPWKLALTCSDGSTDRTSGTIRPGEGTTLVVAWDGGTEDTLRRSEGGSLPEGLPTALPTP
ncbi:hypothetical protein GCM10023329_34330 [Streptomyces sanyensis]|uniref:Lipoprotein n=1 Tax=Streptomyces sanyensis TaxID=568869 RepID=A0ABP9AL08_9ACTN